MTGAIESLPQGAGIVHIGALSFVSPWPEFKATATQMAMLEAAAVVWESPLLADLGSRLVADVEEQMRREAKRRARTPPEGRAVKARIDEEGDVYRPVALISGKELGLQALVSTDGRRYLPDPYRQKDSRPHPALDKFDRVAAVQPPPAPLDIATMSQEQADLMRQADEKLASAQRRRLLRIRHDSKGRVISHGRVTQAERDERRFARDAYAQLGLGTLNKRDGDEVRRGRSESFALADARGRLERREACKALLSHLTNGESLRMRRFRSRGRRSAIARELLELRRTLLEEARASVLKDVAAGGRRLTRDGLDSLPLDQIQKTAALWYRALYERTERGARVASIGGRVGGEPNDRNVKDWGADQIARKEVEARVMAIKSGNGRAITALRLVAGDGRTITAISGGKSSARKLNAEALIQALDVVADYRGLQ